MIYKFRNGVDSVPVGNNSSLIGGWIVWPPVIPHKEKNLTKYWDVIEPKNEPILQIGLN